MITDIRLRSQQLVDPIFDEPHELVAWMGAMQGQEYNMVKWALGMRLKNPNLQKVEAALERGEILRTHVLRPTWHLVAAEDIRWMLKLSAKRVISAYNSYWKNHGITEDLHTRCCDAIVKALEGNKNLTREEISEALDHAGVTVANELVKYFLGRMEADGIVCNGADKGNKRTYALLDERVPVTPELSKEEALARLAIKYFRSHSPASLQDFIWWSGLSTLEAKQAVGLITTELITERVDHTDWFIHVSVDQCRKVKQIVHLLPSFDEYLISYKDRSMILDPKFYGKAFNSYGIFYPVILYNGKIVGNWNKLVKKKRMEIECSFFLENMNVDRVEVERAMERLRRFSGF